LYRETDRARNVAADAAEFSTRSERHPAAAVAWSAAPLSEPASPPPLAQVLPAEALSSAQTPLLAPESSPLQELPSARAPSPPVEPLLPLVETPPLLVTAGSPELDDLPIDVDVVDEDARVPQPELPPLAAAQGQNPVLPARSGPVADGASTHAPPSGASLAAGVEAAAEPAVREAVASEAVVSEAVASEAVVSRLDAEAKGLLPREAAPIESSDEDSFSDAEVSPPPASLRSDVDALLASFLSDTRSDANLALALRRMMGLEPSGARPPRVVRADPWGQQSSG
jgi:hypothetical protein